MSCKDSERRTSTCSLTPPVRRCVMLDAIGAGRLMRRVNFMRHFHYHRVCPKCDSVIPFWRIATALFQVRCPGCGAYLVRRKITFLQSFVFTLIAMPFVVCAVLVNTPFREVHLPIAVRIACFVVGAQASQLYLDLTSALELRTKGNRSI